MFFIRELGEAFCNDINKVATGELTGGGRSLSPPSELELRTSAKAQRAPTSGGPGAAREGRNLGGPDQSFDRRVIYRIDLCRDLGCLAGLLYRPERLHQRITDPLIVRWIEVLGFKTDWVRLQIIYGGRPG